MVECEWRMMNGKWRLMIREWKMANIHWGMANGLNGIGEQTGQCLLASGEQKLSICANIQ